MEETLQEEAVGFLVSLKEQYNSTQTVIDAVIPGVNRIKQRFLEVLEVSCNDLYLSYATALMLARLCNIQFSFFFLGSANLKIWQEHPG